MKRFRRLLIAALVIFALLVVTGAFFTVSETQQAVILHLGKPVRVIVGDRTPEEMAALEDWMAANAPGVELSSGAGLYFKIPFVQEARILEDRILEYDDDPADVVTKDKKHIQVDSYARWRIINPLLFITSIRTEAAARSRLDDIIYSVIRQELGKSNLIHIVRSTNDPVGLGTSVRLVDNVTYSDSAGDMMTMSDGELLEVISLVRVPAGQGRNNLLERVAESCDLLTREYGIEIIDVRVKRADLPPENQAAVFVRMQAERNRISTRYRAEGNRIAQTILAETDLRVDSILAQARMTSLSIRGYADSAAAAIYADAYNAYPDFYRFSRSLETLESVLASDDEIVVSTEGVFEYFVSSPGEIR
jgi:membrane protease subunit HflC